MKTPLHATPGTRFMWLAAVAISSTLLHATPEMGPTNADEAISFVTMEMKADSKLREAPLKVEMQDGIAILRGRAESLNLAERAAERAMAIDHVVAVSNQIEIKEFSGSNAVLEKSIVAALKSDSAIDASQVKVSAEDGTVWLTGTVGTWDEQEIAREIVSRISGVRLIDNQLKVSFEGIRSDAQMTAQISEIIANDPLYDGLHISAQVKDGVVELEGEVGSKGEYDRLVRRVYITGVFEVNANLLTINSDLKLEAMGDKNYSPERINELAGSVLKLDPRVDHKPITVSVFEGTATLTGQASNADEKAAAEMAVRGVPGVLRVSNEIKIGGSREMASIGLGR